tara:strand:- start:3013 stop:3498 length:486 start_codon:yes stop_codon:yes gene_type:complete
MIDFMVIGLPRSRTTWMANWLTTTSTLCLHDAISTHTQAELDSYPTNRKFGISETAIFHLGNKLNAHPAKKLIIHRPIHEIYKSIGRPIPFPNADCLLQEIKGLHIQHKDINSRAEEIWMHLIGSKFDSKRFNVLSGMNVQPNFKGLRPQNQKVIQTWLGF